MNRDDKTIEIMYKSYKYRIYPTSSQKELMAKHFGACRFIYNLGLETKQACDLNWKGEQHGKCIISIQKVF